MIFPPPIKKGDTIGIIAPAGKMTENIIVQACKRIESLGYKVKVGQHLNKHYCNFSATDINRKSDLQLMFDDEEVKAIICTRGGYGVIRIIDDINFSKFNLNPKWVVGFSDITVLHAAIQKLGIASIHGPMCKSLLNFTDTGIDVDVLFSFLEGETPEYLINPHLNNRLGEASGELIGGNLSLLYSLRGTKLDFNPVGKILFIEDLSEYLYHLDRIMHNLKLGGVLEKISGLVVGQFTNMKDNQRPFGETVEEIIYNSVANYDYPVAFNFPAGHVETNFPLILGDDVLLKVEEDQVSLVSM